MSEFQIYQFRSLDRPFTEAERREIGSWSSRTRPTANSATFNYAYGDFPKDVEKVMAQYFDAMLYVSNWGAKRLIFRLPKNLTDAQALTAYTFENDWSSDYIALQKHSDCYLLDLYFNNEEGGGWLEEEDYDLHDFTPLREDILQGDYRSLYLLWLQFAQNATAEEEEENKQLTPPPLPANLSKMGPALVALVEFFEIDQDVVAAMKSASPESEAPPLDYPRLIGQLPEEERMAWLIRLANDEPRLVLNFTKRLRELVPSQPSKTSASLSLAQITALTDAQRKERTAQEAEAARLVHLQKMKQFAREEVTMWGSIAANILKATSSSYDQATQMLRDLHDLAVYQGKEADFRVQMAALREQYARRQPLIRRFDKAGL